MIQQIPQKAQLQIVYDQKIQAARTRIEEVIPMSAFWILDADKNGFKVHTALDKETGHTWSRGEGIVPYTSKEILEIIEDPAIRGEYDSMFEKGHIVEHVEEGIQGIVYQKFKSILVVSSRDVLVVTKKTTIQDGTITLLATSCPQYPFPEVKSTVRADLVTAGWIIKPFDEGRSCVVLFITLVDPKGSIPKKIVGMTANVQGQCIENLKKYLDKKNKNIKK